MDPTRRFGELLVELGFVTTRQVEQALALQPLTGARMGEALLSLGFLTRPQLQRALSWAVSRGQAVELERPLLGEVLLGLQYVDQPALDAALDEHRRSGRRLGEVLVARGAVDHRQLYEALGVQQRLGRIPNFAESPPPALPLRGHSLVVIDHSELSCALLADGLEAQGFSVTTFTDPFQALEQLDLLKPDLVLAALDMPGLEGAQLCSRVKLGPRPLPVILLTSDEVDAPHTGADDLVPRGASVDALAARVTTVLRRTTDTARVRQLLARSASDEVVNQVLSAGRLALAGERRQVTVLFADLRHFNAWADQHPPEEVLRLLNRVLGGLAEVVLEGRGTLDKFLGDGLMAVWGAPVPHEDDVGAAVSAAMAMFDLLRGLEGTLQLGIGVNTGPVISGSVGSARRTDYTCVGDTVNVAASLCALAAGGELLLGEATARALAMPAAVQALAPVRVKGRTQPLTPWVVRPALKEQLDLRHLTRGR